MKATARLNLRVSASDDRLIRKAAAAQETTVTEFVLESVRRGAEAVLADRTQFTVDAKRWAAFTRALERPVKVKPRLRKLLTEPSVVESDDA